MSAILILFKKKKNNLISVKFKLKHTHTVWFQYILVCVLFSFNYIKRAILPCYNLNSHFAFHNNHKKIFLLFKEANIKDKYLSLNSRELRKKILIKYLN
jgi:hypothetical protein